MNQRLTDIRRAQLDQLLSGGTNMAGGGLLKSVAKAAKPAAKAVTKVVEAAPQAEALRLAQQRAALPPIKGGLGLPKGNTPEQRAEAMGFDLETFHGTDSPDIKSLDPKRTKIIEGVFSTTNPSNASTYAKGAAEKGRAGSESAPNVMPLLLRSEAHPKALSSWNKDTIDSFRKSRSQGVQRPESEVAVTFDPDQIRSRFAAFDPFRKTAATAAAMGVAAPDLLAKEQDKAQGGLVHLAGGGDPRKRGLFPKMSMQAIVDTPGFDPEVPSDLSRAYARRMAEKEAYQRSMADQKLTPAQRAVAGAEATGMLGSAMFEGVQQLPKLMDGEDAYMKAVGERMYQPRFQPEKAAEYAGNVGDFLEKLETEYKMPQLLPELLPFTGAAEAAKQQAKKAVKQGALTAASRMNAGPKAGSMAAQRGVVKMPGGNFLTGRVEKDVNPLRQQTGGGNDPAEMLRQMREKYTPEAIESLPDISRPAIIASIANLEKDAAINKWIDSNLSNYIKKQMGTPDDPVRALAEQGITHKSNLLNEYPRDQEALMQQRKAAGFPEEGMAQSDLAKAWERASDESLASHRAGDIQGMPEKFTKHNEAERKMIAAREELDKKFLNHIEKEIGLNDKEAASLVRGMTYDEKARLIGDQDLLQTNINYQATHDPMMSSYIALGRENPWIAKVAPETTIYSPYTGDLGFDHIVDVLKQDVAEGRIRPEQLNKVSMEQAVRRAYEYDQEMAKKMAETQAKVTEGMPIHKEYPEGYKWIELAAPKPELEPGHVMGRPSGYPDLHAVIDEKTGQSVSIGATPEEAIRLYKREEREKNLGSALKYEGDTMGHCVGGYCPDVLEGRSRIYSLRDAKGEPHVTIETKPGGGHEYAGEKNKEIIRLAEERGIQKYMAPGNEALWAEAEKNLAERGITAPQYIQQIKGKGNRAPKEEYLPFVQDFVKGGNWSDVGDLRNTGLIRKSDLIDKFSSDELDAIGSGEYLTKAEHDDLLLKALRPPPEQGMAGGGSVGLKNALNNLLRTDKPEVHMGIGGSAAKAALKAAEAAKVAGKAAEYLPGVHYADPLKMPTMKMSEALGNAGAEGKTLNFTETDRSRVFGPNRGGAGFSGLQHYSLPHQEANTVWGFGNKTTAEKKIRQNDPENTIWTTYAGSPNQHKSNTIVVKDALSQLQSADSQGLVNPKQIEFINKRIREAVGQNGNPLFPKDFDITDPKAFDYATTFDRRAAISDALMGVGVKKPMISKEFKAANPGVKWSDAANIDAILRRETDPAMLDANTFDVGPHLFIMDNGVIERPDLNEAFPYQVTGTDLGLRYELAPMRTAAPDWIKARNIKPNEPINAWAMSRAAPSQFVSEAYLTSLQKQGKKKGGLAQTKKVKRHGNTVPH